VTKLKLLPNIIFVLAALSPALIVMLYQFGWGTALNLDIAIGSALFLELICLRLAKQKIHLNQFASSILIAVFIGISLPPFSPWWIIVFATVLSILGKNAFGINNKHPFNAAMIGYAGTLVSFPGYLATWIIPKSLDLGASQQLSLSESLAITFQTKNIPDSMTGATALEIFKFSDDGLMVDQIYQSNKIFHEAFFMISGWEWINIAFLAGGIFLLLTKKISWESPFAMLAMIVFLSLIFFDNGSSNSGGSPVMHLLGGATMIGAFFIITDPASAPSTSRGKIIFGSIVGFFIYIIRVWGGYPDAIAFAVLLGNFSVPLIDRLTMGQISSKDFDKSTGQN